MKNSLDQLESVLDQITARLDELERRLSALEKGPQVPQPFSERQAQEPLVVRHPLGQLSASRPAGVMALIGKVFLGLAGAYLLRAVAESGTVPYVAIVPVALLYAAIWLIAAWRVRDGARLAATAYSIAAAMIGSPMLAELTLRFHVLRTEVTAGLLVGFVALAFSLAWKRDLAPLAAVATIASTGTALVLLAAAHDPAPFTAALLVIAAATEFAGWRGRWIKLRPVTALAADFAVLALTVIYTQSEGLPPEYRPVAISVLLALIAALFAIYGLSAAVRTIVLRREIAIFEIVQTVAAFTLAAVGQLRASHGAAVVPLGAFCLLAAGACYWGAFGRFAPLGERRNYHVFAAWSLGLALTGSIMAMPTWLLGMGLSLLAVTATAAAVRSRRQALAFHGLTYLAAAVAVSGLAENLESILAGDMSQTINGAVWMVVGAVAVCYALFLMYPIVKDVWRHRLLRLGFAAPAAATACAILILVLLLMSPSGGPSAIAVARTLGLCLIAVALAWCGSRWKQTELVWLAYTAVAFCTLKLLFEDLRLGSAGPLAISLFLYGSTWLLLPRLARARAIQD